MEVVEEYKGVNREESCRMVSESNENKKKPKLSEVIDSDVIEEAYRRRLMKREKI